MSEMSEELRAIDLKILGSEQPASVSPLQISLSRGPESARMVSFYILSTRGRQPLPKHIFWRLIILILMLNSFVLLSLFQLSCSTLMLLL